MPNPHDKPSLPALLRGRKVVLVNHSDTLGEGSVATFRLMQALRREGVDARMVVYTKRSAEANVSYQGTRLMRGIRYCLELLQILGHSGFSCDNIFSVSTGSFAINVHTHPWVKEADIVCINWVNRGLMNLNGIRRLHRMGKKIVWTLHDMWPFTGICHNAGVCDYYTDSCGNCLFLKDGGHPGDLSHEMWEKKMALYTDIPLTFVASSRWLEIKARNSSLLRNKPVMTIPSPIPVDQYYTSPGSHIDALLTVTKPNLILMGATWLDAPGKGLEYAIEALNHIFDNYPEIASETAVYLFGQMHNPETLDNLRMSHRWLGRINEPKILRYLYSSAKVVLSTSLLENIPAPVIEGMASGAIPVVFGDPHREDTVRHLATGYIARTRDSLDIVKGVLWALQTDISRDELHEYVRENFSSHTVARRYIDLFANLLDPSTPTT